MKPKLHALELTEENNEFIVSGVYTKHDDPYGFHEQFPHIEERETHDDNNQGVYRKQQGDSYATYYQALSAARELKGKLGKPLTDFVWLSTEAARKKIRNN